MTIMSLKNTRCEK